tara:strand:- start:112 stop:639 length:528 start_codon:yes stop_codon:yes gene_type:complete
MINYEITKAEPQQLKLQVKYTKTDCPDYWINFVVEDFAEANLHKVAEEGADRARIFYDAIAKLPNEVTLSDTTGSVPQRVYVEPPEYDKTTHDAVFTWVEADGVLTQTWQIVEKSDDDKADAIRNQRGTLLLETDYFALTDVTMPDDMATYRQALRDVPQQSGFPSSVDWPTKPS